MSSGDPSFPAYIHTATPPSSYVEAQAPHALEVVVDNLLALGLAVRSIVGVGAVLQEAIVPQLLGLWAGAASVFE